MEETAVNWILWLAKSTVGDEDDEKLGRIVRAIHHGASYMLILCVLMSFTLIPAFWFQTLVLGTCGLVWVQHMVFHGCVVSRVEQRLLKDETSFVDPYLELFGIEATERSKQGILMLLSTVGMFLFTLAWGGRLVREVLPLVTAQVRAAAPGLHIPLPLSSPSGSLVPS